MRFCLAIAAAAIAAGLGWHAVAPPPAGSTAGLTICEAVWHDQARNRDVPVRIRMPAGDAKVPLILFSHGLGGSLDAGTLWARAWVADGNAVIHMQHAGSDRGILGTGHFRDAMSGEQLRNRAGDVHFVLDEVSRRPREGACDLRRLDLQRIGISGHSFGAQTTLAIAGTHYPFASFADPRVRAAVALSPQPAILADKAAFGEIRMPFLSITGTEDALPQLTQVTPQDRERPFRAMAPGDKFLLVMKDGNHMMFGGQDNIPLVGTTPVPHIRETVIRATNLFWRGYLRDDKIARAELERLAGTLPPGDRFETR